MRAVEPRRPRAAPKLGVGLALTFGVALTVPLGCSRGAAVETAAPTASEWPTLPAVDLDSPAYAGTWIGPELRLTFAGPWVYVRPSDDPSQAPIELRVEVERSSGDAFALRTSIAGVLPADFLRAPDWTVLVEPGQLAIAMGDEPLTAYVAPDSDADPEPEPVLPGPSMLAELALPPELSMAGAIACLEIANDRCVALEAGGPLAGGCRELQWGSCASQLRPDAADPTVRAAVAAAAQIHLQLLVLRWATAVHAAADPDQADSAAALLTRAQAEAKQLLTRLAEDGPLPADDPHLPELRARL